MKKSLDPWLAGKFDGGFPHGSVWRAIPFTILHH